jgi:hypothetical protein
LLANWQAREALNTQRGAVANSVLDEAKSTALLGLTETAKTSEAAASLLATASMAMIVGLLV